ncbi:TPA: hypothetical protein HA317_01225, partial [Candidatus Woesearchaeota archaeon]|nr:hypothetical protein [Candidatus Woesearchaeota archaeon]
MGDEARNLDYLFVLKALDEIPFGVGRRLLIDFLQGKKTNESIARNRLHLKKSFASMAYSKDEINSLIDNLLMNGLIQLTSINGNKFWKVLELTAKGGREISNPSLYKKKLAFNFRETRTMITEEDKLLFDALAGFLHEFNDGQKKSTTSNKKHILCIAGAGTG